MLGNTVEESPPLKLSLYVHFKNRGTLSSFGNIQRIIKYVTIDTSVVSAPKITYIIISRYLVKSSFHCDGCRAILNISFILSNYISAISSKSSLCRLPSPISP